MLTELIKTHNDATLEELCQMFEEKTKAFAISDLTPAYKSKAHSVKRGIALQEQRQQIVLRDEILSQNLLDIWWFMHTKVDIEL